MILPQYACNECGFETNDRQQFKWHTIDRHTFKESKLIKRDLLLKQEDI